MKDRQYSGMFADYVVHS